MTELELLQQIYNVQFSLYAVTCFVIFVILPLCGIIWFLKRIWFVFM